MRKKRDSIPKQVLKLITENGPSTKWDIKIKSTLPYPRVNDAINTLLKANLIQVIGIRKSKKNLEMKVYTLTFKGVLQQLSSIELVQPSGIGEAGETKEALLKRYNEELQEYRTKLQKLIKFLVAKGKELDYAIFAEINWLKENYGVLVLHEIVRIAKEQRTPSFLIRIQEQQRHIQRNIRNELHTLKKIPSLRKMTGFIGEKENRQFFEIDNLTDRKSELLEQTRIMKASLVSENRFLMKSYALALFQLISFIPKKTKSSNKVLAKLASELLSNSKKELIPLEKVLKMFRENKNDGK